jgi:uncharacterized OB-fold protein
VVHHAVQPGFVNETPYVLMMVELDVQRGSPTADDVIRIPTNLVTATFTPDLSEQAGINSPVDVVFEPFGPGLAIPKWRLVAEAGRVTPWRFPL